MTTKLIILIAIGFLIFGAVVFVIVKACRYRRNHPDEIYWPYNGPMKRRHSKQTPKTLLLAALTLGCMLCGSNAFAQNPDGTYDHPYLIKDSTALYAFAQCINSGQNFSYRYTDSMFVLDPNGPIPAYGEGTYFKQIANIDLAGKTWHPIGTSPTTGFRGNYDGDVNNIINLKLTANQPALFCYSTGTIGHLTMQDPVFADNVNNSGALATYVMGGTIRDCHVNCSPGSPLVFNGKNCGALIGCIGIPDGQKADDVTIYRCSSNCEIISNYQQTSANDQNSVAGVVAVINAHHYLVTRCYNFGNIISTYRPKFQEDTLSVAGVVGRGLVPTTPSLISKCYNKGHITAHCGYIGGVAGLFDAESGLSNNTRCNIDSCFNTGRITGVCVLYSSDTMPANYYSLSPQLRPAADSSLNILSVGGVVAPCKAKTRYSFNTGIITLTKHPHPKFNIKGDQGVVGLGSIAEHCFNVGEIYNYETRNGRAAGVASDTARYCINAVAIYDRNLTYSYLPRSISNNYSINCIADAQMVPDGLDGILYPSVKIFGGDPTIMDILGDEHWVFGTNVYPQLKWTQEGGDGEDAKNFAIAASEPIFLSDIDIYHVTNPFRLGCSDTKLYWHVPKHNCLVTIDNQSCSGGFIWPTVDTVSECDIIVPLTAILSSDDTIKVTHLLHSITPPSDILTVDNLNELKMLRDSVNSGKSFFYKNHKLPRYAEGVTFKLTTDLNMGYQSPWEPIGSVMSGSRFAGRFLGDGHTIYNLSLDNATPNRDKNANFGGLFGMLSGEVRDLIFENLSADSTTIVAGAVCALMNGATIENCIVKGHIETSKSNNYYALSGIGGIAGVSLTARIQDSIFQCSDTIRGCINYADITTHVGRGKNIAFHSVGGIIGHGGVVIDCANAGNISASKDCGYLGGIGGDLTSALRCFNTGRINIEEANQTGNFYVGGVVGLNEADSAVRYCYNAGPIQGSDRNYVGGIIGKGNPKYCYTSNTTICRGAHTGSIVGISEHDQNCYYDKQMSPMAANNGSNIPARSVKGFETTAMLGSALSDSLGDNTNWIFTPGLYPQLAISADIETQHAASLRAQLSRVSVMPVVLGSGQNWATAHDSIPLKGCDDHFFWKKISGNVSVNDCNVHTSNRDKGTMEFAATLDSVPYRYITLIFNLEESHAYVITSLRQFDTMRMVINQGGYYNLIDSTFHLTIPAGANANDFIAIMDGGKDCYFKLTPSEIDIEVLRWSDNSQKHWTPIGGYADNTCGFEGRTFKGIFDGNGCTVKRLQFEGCNNPRIGLFGVIEGGTVKNLILDNPKGDIHYDTIGFLCSINKGGTIYNCEIVNSVWEFDTLVYMSSNIGFLCGKNEKGIIDSCRIKNAKILRLPGAINTYNRHNMGGICALNDRGVISRCRVEDFRYEDRSDFYTIVENLGGICGKNYHGQLLNDTIARSQFLLRVAKQYKNVGGICGLSGFFSDDTDKEASYGYMPSVIDGCVNDGFTFTADTCNGYGDCIKNIRHVGGIVGMCQGQNITLTNCHNLAGKISVCADSVGGICGRFINEGGESYIRNCSNHVNVTGSSYVGGVVGIISGANIYDSQNDGTIRAAAGPRYWAEKPAGYYAGGIAGALTGKSGLITCSNSGLVNTDSNYVGGMAGVMLENSSLYLCTNNGTVRGRDQVGGLAGLVCQNAWFDNCSVLGEGKVSGIAQVGGLVGYLKGVGAHKCRNSRNDAQKIFYAGMGGGVYGYAEDSTMLENCSSTNIVRYDTVMDITSIGQLLSFRQNVNNGNTYEGTLVRLNCNLEITSDWEPIGKNPEHPFRGIFDGLDHSIKYTINVNYPYNYDEEDYYYQGLFGYMEGTVRNLDLVDCSISADNSDYVGLVAGYCHGSILDCGSYAHYDSPKVKGRNYVGGLVGMAYNSEIKNCYNGLNVSGEQYVGGIVGDFTANKNIVTYGGMPYNLYGGNVNQCFNYGMIQSRITYNCYAGGIAGSTSTEIKHCYNSGSVNGSHRAGGIAGQLLGDSIHHCYNTGYLPYGSMAIVSDCGPTNGYSIYDCFYDRQQCPAEDEKATALRTCEMVGGANTSMRSALGDMYWTYNDNEYPSLTRFYQKAGIIVPISVKPLLLPGYMPVDNIMVNFSGATGNNSCTQETRIVWSRYNTLAAAAVDIGQCMPYKDSILINSIGYDTLRVSYNQPLGVQRLVPVRVRNVPVNYRESNVTAFNSYTWPVNSTTYGKSGFYTHSKTEQITHRIIYYALNLTIVNVDCRIEQVKGTCGTIPDGALLSTVSGGTGNGFRYKWTNDNNDSLGNLPNLANILPGTYHLTLTDSLISTCVLTQTVTLGEPEPVNLTISGCSESKNYDGTPFTAYRYVVQEEGYAPDTLNAGQYAILSNGDTLHVSLSNPVNISNPFDSPEGVSITSYSITNGIDHRCHYHVTQNASSVTIDQRPVTITVFDAEKNYGEDDPEFTGTVTGLVHDNDLGTISFYRTDATQQAVGTYVDVLTATYTENTNYVVTVNNGTFTINCKHTLYSITNWPDTTTVPGVCFAPTNTDLLPSDNAFQAKYQYHVTHTDSVLRSDPCDWLCARTYTNTWNPVDYNVNCELESRVMYISGGDTTGPKLTIDTLKVDACRFKGDIDDIIPDKQVLFFDDCSGVAAISYTQDTTVNDPSWTIRRIYELRDFCGNLNFDTLYICGVDTIPPRPDPRAFPQQVVNDTLWRDPVCRCDTNPAHFIQITDNPHVVVRRFDLIDNCDEYDENGPYSIGLLSAEKTVKNGENCVDTAVISYVVSDRSGNTATYYHAQLITDTIPPTVNLSPDTVTICYIPNTSYDSTLSVALTTTDWTFTIHDNCTRQLDSSAIRWFIDRSARDVDHPYGYQTIGYGSGIRHYYYYLYATDSCGNTAAATAVIIINPSPILDTIENREQTIDYGQNIQTVVLAYDFTDTVYVSPFSGITRQDYNDDFHSYTQLLHSPYYAGDSTLRVSISNRYNCYPMDTSIIIRVNPHPITITTYGATKKYDGTPLTNTEYTCVTTGTTDGYPFIFDDTITTIIFPSQTEVGIHDNQPAVKITPKGNTTADKTLSYAITYVFDSLRVTPNNSPITVIPGSDTVRYNGDTLTRTAHEDFTVTGVPDSLIWEATADGKVKNVTPGPGEKTSNEITSFRILDNGGHDVTNFFTTIDTSATGTLMVTKSPVTLTSGSKTREYNGKFLSNAEVEGINANGLTVETGWGHNEGATYQFMDSLLTIGELPNTFTYSLKENTNPDNYEISQSQGMLKVIANTAAIAIVSADSSWEYDNVTHSKPEYTVTYNNTQVTAVPGSNGLKFELPTGDTLTVTPTFGGVKIPSDNSANNNSFTYSLEHLDQYTASNITATFGTLEIIPNSTHISVVSASDSMFYNGDSLSRQANVTVTGVPEGFTWTAAADGIVRNVVPGNGEKSVNEVAEFKIFNAANEDVTAYFSNIDTIEGILKIIPRPLTLTSGSKTRQYNGLVLTNNDVEGRNDNGLTVEEGWIAGEGATYEFTGKQQYVGASANAFSYTMKSNTIASNYHIVKTEGTLEITPNTNQITVVPTGGSKIYDGSPLTKTAHDDFTVTGVPEGHTWTAQADGIVKNVVPGTDEKSVNAVSVFQLFHDTIDVTNQFSNIDKSATATLAILPKGLTLTSGGKTREYNGLALTNNDVEGRNTNGLTEEDGWIAGEGATYEFTGSQLFVGESTNAFNILPNVNTVVTNYNIQKTQGTLKITASTASMAITSADGSWMYDGSTHTKPEYAVTYNGAGINAAVGSNGLKFELPTGDTLTVTPTTGGVTTFNDNAPSNNSFAYAIEHQDQYTAVNITATYGTLAITANTASMAITSADGSWMYDGNTHTKPEYTVTYNGTGINAAVGSNGLKFELPTGDTLTVTPTFGGVTVLSDNILNNNIFDYVIEHQNQYTAANITATYGTLGITANTTPITVVPAGGSKIYDGTPLTKTADTDFTVTGVPEGLTWKAKANGTVTNVVPGDGEKSTNAVTEFKILQDTTDVTSQFSHINTSAIGTLSITPKAVTMTSGGKTREYNGLALTNNEVEGRNTNGLTVETGWADNEGASYVFTGTQTTIGKCVNTFSYTLKSNTIASNYIITKTEDTLEITANTTTITVVPGSGSKTYDGTPLTKRALDDFTVNGVPEGFTWTATADGTVTNVTPGAGEKAVNAVSGFKISNASNEDVTHQFSNIDTSATGMLTIIPASLRVKANANTKVYGENDPTFTATVTGVIEGENFVPNYTIDREIGDNVGLYVITPTGDIAQGNYVVTYDTALFTILCRNIVEPTNWPANLPNQNTCFGNADTIGLKDASEIQTLFANCNPVTNASEITVTAQDNATATSDCEWTWIRTYNISITGGCASTTKTMSVSGGDSTKPSFNVPAAISLCANDDGSFNISPDITGNVTVATDNCTASEDLTVSFTDGDTITLPNGKRQTIRTWTVTDACGNDSVQTQVIFINPLPEISVTPELQTIVLEDPITPVTVTSQYSQYITSAISLNNVATSFANVGLGVQETAQGLEVSGTPADTGTYKLLFTAISDQFPVCYPKQAEATVIVRMMQDTVKVISGSASKPYDGTPLTNHNYVVTLGNDTIPAIEGSNGLVFSVHFNDSLTITPVSSLTNAGTIANEFTCVLQHPNHYKGLVLKYGTLTVNKATLSMSLDTVRVYNGHPFVVTADQLHVTGLAETDTITGGTISTEGHTAGTYVCEEGNFNAFLENGVAVKSGFSINNGLGNYVPDFDVKLRIDPITTGFNCPDNLDIVIWDGSSDTVVTPPSSATLTPMVDNIVILNNFDDQNPLAPGTHTIVWALTDDLGDTMTTCNQTVTVDYAPCLGVSYHGHNYDAVRIGSQCWLTEDLRWATGNHHAYNEDSSYPEKFGYLYSWYTAVAVAEDDVNAVPLTATADNGTLYVQGICPAGWAVPSMSDIAELGLFVGSASLLKDPSSEYWLAGYEGLVGGSGFNARGGGRYNAPLNRYEDLRTSYHLWASDATPGSITIMSACLSYFCDKFILYDPNQKNDRKSVRCIRKVAP